MSILIYSKNDCNYCEKAKKLLNDLKSQYNITYSEISLNKSIDPMYYDTTVSMLKAKYNHNTFPFIIINDNFIGGYTDLEKIYSTGYLFKLLSINDETFVDF
jgi:glutaredoxin